ncbi:DNA replication and repair protein RecO [Anaerosphaera aminiphila DSM 21120]|uniref:DNA repair protein RecO n=1 Tax=Anaerosphaera aminiphila DSM 21120 TaxID=1120995 RepID=A0A1M5RIY0_9FIRM|nr:DNA repair protein RecO [Anaerosphaera aminiphila]SHH26245.1 DNA replication and repair protein RecO [Anaerosphaera aminiphila DSM 21120]
MEKTTAEIIVLSEQKYKETSKILRVFTRELGKVSILAKGALSAKSPLTSTTQIFTNSTVKLIKGKSFYYIEHSKLLNSNFEIRSNYENLIMGSFILELVDKTFLEGETNEKVFELLKKMLLLISKKEDVMPLVMAFELKYMSFLGYRPKIRECKNSVFSVLDGGIIEKPTEYQEKCYKLSDKDIYYLNKLLYTSLDELEEENFTELSNLQNIILEYIKYNLEISEFNSLLLI